jgi:hypothetical protein
MAGKSGLFTTYALITDAAILATYASRRLYISVQKPAVKKVGGGRSNAFPPHNATLFSR